MMAKKRKKQTWQFIGWVGKGGWPHWAARVPVDCYESLQGIFRTKDTENVWAEGEWPPRKVRITIEEV